MIDEKKTAKIPHNVVLEDRHSLSISGVSDVDSFDEQTVVVLTDMGELCIRGAGLHINRLSVETGELSVEGKVSQLSYNDDSPRASGFFGRLFK